MKDEVGEVVDTTSDHFDGLEPSTAYTYTVVAKGDGVSTLDSEPVTSSFTTGDPQLTPPANLVVSGVGTDTATLTWDPVDNATDYSVYATNVTNGGVNSSDETAQTTYTFIGLLPGCDFTAYVTAHDSTGTWGISGKSEVVSFATTSAS
ncbi:fibronectin type III domain-containing protein [Streptomyces sp. NBC_00470]|uniref:fibronectin type III domain-containing protein n=1 Tax=Streptomyces sp. NBC_00470 TaxID=2975753 RepID=UPI0030DE4F6A